MKRTDYSFYAKPTKTKVLEYGISFPEKEMPGVEGVAFFHRRAFGKPFEKWVVRICYRTPDGKIFTEKTAFGAAGTGFNPNSFLQLDTTKEMVSGMAEEAVSGVSREIKRRRKQAAILLAEMQNYAGTLAGFENEAKKVRRKTAAAK